MGRRTTRPWPRTSPGASRRAPTSARPSASACPGPRSSATRTARRRSPTSSASTSSSGASSRKARPSARSGRSTSTSRCRTSTRSHATPSAGGTAYDAFVKEFGNKGREFLDALGIRRIPASQVTLHPFLLGERFQRIADKAVLRKNGVNKTGTDELKK